MKNTEDKPKVILNEKLEKVLNELGNTPIDEPEIFEALDEKPLDKSKVLKLIFTPRDLSIKDFPAIDVAKFFNAVVKRITDTKDEDGNYKVTPNTSDYNLPDFEQVELITEEMMKMHRSREEQSEIHAQIESGEKVDKKKLKKIVKDFEKILKRLDELTWEITGLNKDDLTDWERNLITEQIYTSVQEVELTSMGKL